MRSIFQLYFIWFITINSNASSNVLDLLPGNGWNNLDYTEQNRIFVNEDFTKTFISPNGIIYTLPSCFDYTRSSQDHEGINSQIVKNIDDINELFSFSTSIEAGGSFDKGLIKASGSFSVDYKTLRRQITTDEMLIVKSFRRISHFTIKIPPSMCKFTESFKKAVQNLGDLIKKNDDRALRQESVKLLKTFGTHFIKVITIGGIFTSESSIESSKINKTIDSDFNIKQAAEFKFALLADGKEQMESNASEYQQSFLNKDKSRFERIIQGGDSSKKVLNEWAKTVDTNYAVINRQVSSLYELFEKQYLLPSFNEQFWTQYGSKLHSLVKNVTITLYEQNTHRGCLDINRENFNPFANSHDEKACNNVTDIYRFGGIFTGKCLKVKNILGGDHTCIANYNQHSVFQNVTSAFNLYFCYSTENSSIYETQHMYFGGIYTDSYKNPATKDHSCPLRYDRISVLVDGTKIVFCLSRDVTLSTTFIYKFGGIFSSCDYYNPMANGDTCPIGFQEYPLVDYQSCAISYCMNVTTDQYPDIIYPSDNRRLLRSTIFREDDECGNNGNFLHIKFNYVIITLIFFTTITFM